MNQLSGFHDFLSEGGLDNHQDRPRAITMFVIEKTMTGDCNDDIMKRIYWSTVWGYTLYDVIYKWNFNKKRQKPIIKLELKIISSKFEI